MPAHGWFATYKGVEFADPLVCWALVTDEDGEDAVVGLVAADGYTSIVEEISNFDDYVHDSEIKRATEALAALA